MAIGLPLGLGTLRGTLPEWPVAHFILGVSVPALAEHQQSEGQSEVADLMKAAEAGNAQAQAELGRLYLGGRGVKQDYPTAAKWLQLAAEQGDSESQLELRQLFEEGRGTNPGLREGAYVAESCSGGRHYRGEGAPRKVNSQDDA